MGVLSDVACLTYADFVRFVEMIRQAHAHMSDGITLRNRLDQLITSAFRDDNYRKKRAFYSLKVRLAQLFTEVLVTDGEINQAHELLLTRSNDSAFATSSSLIVIQTTLLCMKAVLYLLAHPQACGPVKIPTLHEFCSNIFTFTHVILALKAKQSKTFLRQNLGWNETATQLIRDLQQAFASTAGRVETCLTYDTLRVALCIATDQLLQVC